jgi:hypothetical protein
MTDQTNFEKDVLQRKAIIYQNVVQPLKKLLEVLGFSQDFEALAPIDPRGPKPIVIKPAALSVPVTGQGYSSDVSLQWLDKLSSINRYISNLSQSPSRRPVRIAILDTGYDDQTIFFENAQRRRRVKGWRDWAEKSETPVDENGHGTHTLALLMKVAPMADLYVARIAKDRTSLKSAVNSVSEVCSQLVSSPTPADIPSSIPTTDAFCLPSLLRLSPGLQ